MSSFAVTVARKPPLASVAATALEHGTGGVNINACRLTTTDNLNGAYAKDAQDRSDGYENWRFKRGDKGNSGEYVQPTGRWPTNGIFQHLPGCGSVCQEGCPVPVLDAQSGVSTSSGGRIANISVGSSTIYGGGKGLGQDLRGDPGYGDKGGASRYFKQVKPDNDGVLVASRNMVCQKCGKPFGVHEGDTVCGVKVIYNQGGT